MSKSAQNLILFGSSDNVQIFLACGTNTYYGITNDISFQIVIVNDNMKYPIETSACYTKFWRSSASIIRKFKIPFVISWQLCLPQAGEILTKSYVYAKSWAFDKKSFYNMLTAVKGAQSYFFNFFPNFWWFWYHKNAHIFLITHVKFHGLRVLRLEDINENESGYGNHNH